MVRSNHSDRVAARRLPARRRVHDEGQHDAGQNGCRTGRRPVLTGLLALLAGAAVPGLAQTPAQAPAQTPAQTPAQNPAQTACQPDRVTLSGPWGTLTFRVEIADTPSQRARGLMFRESLPRNAGMLFVFERPRRASFWMKNTLIPLDMLFIDRTGRVTRIAHMAQPGDLRPIDGGDNVLAVLEINGGLARRYGITEGTLVRHPVFRDGPAAWPC